MNLRDMADQILSEHGLTAGHPDRDEATKRTRKVMVYILEGPPLKKRKG